MRTLLACSFLVLAPSCAFAQGVTVHGITIVNPGIYEVETRNRAIGEKVQRRTWDVVRKIKQVQATLAISARPCLSFGFEYTIEGAPNGSVVPIKMVTKFPGQGLHDPARGGTTFQDEALVNRTIGNKHLRSYTFDQRWEIVPGVWTFQLWYRDKKLAEQSFTVTASEQSAPEGKCVGIPVALSRTRTVVADRTSH